MRKHGKSVEYVLSEQQLNRLWVACSELTNKVLVGLTAYMGMRVSEAVHWRLDWTKQESINIPSKMPCNCWECATKRNGFWKVKSPASERSIPIPGFLQEIIAEFLRMSPDGLKMTRQAAWYRIHQLEAKAKLPHIFPHALRASCATMLAGKGLTAVELCYVMGWSNLKMGEHYIRISTAKQSVKDKMKQIYSK